jgi:hypothetical protein
VGDGWLFSVLLLRVICLYWKKHGEIFQAVSRVKFSHNFQFN